MGRKHQRVSDGRRRSPVRGRSTTHSGSVLRSGCKGRRHDTSQDLRCWAFYQESNMWWTQWSDLGFKIMFGPWRSTVKTRNKFRPRPKARFIWHWGMECYKRAYQTPLPNASLSSRDKVGDLSMVKDGTRGGGQGWLGCDHRHLMLDEASPNNRLFPLSLFSNHIAIPLTLSYRPNELA